MRYAALLLLVLMLSACSGGGVNPRFNFGGPTGTGTLNDIGEMVLRDMIRYCMQHGCSRDPTTKQKQLPPRIYNRIIMPKTEKTK